MDFYIDRAYLYDVLFVSQNAIDGRLFLWGDYYCDNIEKENPFFSEFSYPDATVKYEYLFSLDAMSCLLTAYKDTADIKYKNIFLKLYDYFTEYLKSDSFCDNFSIFNEHTAYCEALLFVKVLDILEQFSLSEEVEKLLYQHAEWLMKKENAITDNNHGLFIVGALYHLGILFGNDEKSKRWIEYGTELFDKLYSNCFFEDGVNNEYSVGYFIMNLDLYEEIERFARRYEIKIPDNIKRGLKKSRGVLSSFAHKDGTFPIIGDGEEKTGIKGDCKSVVYDKSGIAIIKLGDLYLSFKTKTSFQDHAHADVLSITLKYKDNDIIIDPGQYNYDRYDPINRFLRSSAGHSCVFPIYADNLFLLDFCMSCVFFGITKYELRDDYAYLEGGFRINDAVITRKLEVFPDKVIIKDSWECEKPEIIRQRFVFASDLIDRARFFSKDVMLESKVNGINVCMKVETNTDGLYVVPGFGISAYKYQEYKPTLIIDAISSRAAFGEIENTISFGGR